ncbi:MucR family transcriptional regulator [Methylobacterium nodulans]|uniref:Transcriptional regulator, MucR family n=1 Tax=Methylobacterium nodulans (strain LMG 21967 / CNCM I-2342 / ORS 2060) TaxID=460265 RepID=B8IUC6_METNO|nr:MucR family transcriptional regulator [Methylobacterium nodulans]ACL55171.1 transcriptional regulator, MucR family [Methylobacterium nodulans ORS 2060]
MASDLTLITADIVSLYIMNNSIGADDLPNLIRSVHSALEDIDRVEKPQPATLEPPVPIEQTVTPDYIVSLEDGKPYKTLGRHLHTKGLTPDQYRRKWGLPPDYPMIAPSYAAHRAELAKRGSLGRKLGSRAEGDDAE